MLRLFDKAVWVELSSLGYSSGGFGRVAQILVHFVLIRAVYVVFRAVSLVSQEVNLDWLLMKTVVFIVEGIRNWNHWSSVSVDVSL